MIIEIEHIEQNIEQWQNKFVMATGGFDPIHIGHVKYLKASAIIGPLLVVVNKDEYLLTKKDKPFMPLEERMYIVDSIKGVDYVTSWHQDDNSMTGIIDLIRPTYFANGGDRDRENSISSENKLCKELGIITLFGVGGGKIQSSSWLVNGT